MQLTFKKLGLSQEDILNMEKFGLPLDKKTKNILQKIYQDTNLAQKDDIDAFEKLIGFSLPKDYIEFLMKYNGGYPSRNLITDDVVIDYFLALNSEYDQYSITTKFHDFMKFGVPIATTPNGDYVILSKNGSVLLFEHELSYHKDDKLVVLADSFSSLLNALY